MNQTNTLTNPAKAAINYALSVEDGLTFLSLLNDGDIDACRTRWPDAPEECYLEEDTYTQYTLRNWKDEPIYVAQVLTNSNHARSALELAVKNGVELTGLMLKDVNLAGANLSGADLSHCNLSGCNLSGCNLSSAEIKYTVLQECVLVGANLRYANLEGANLFNVNAKNASFRAADLDRANLTYMDAQDANFTNASLRNSTIVGANFKGATMSKSVLLEADLTRTNIDFLQMEDIIGEGQRVKNLHTDKWNVSYTKDKMQIGKQMQSIDSWLSKSDEEMSVLGTDGPSWSKRWLPIIKQILTLSPAK